MTVVRIDSRVPDRRRNDMPPRQVQAIAAALDAACAASAARVARLLGTDVCPPRGMPRPDLTHVGTPRPHVKPYDWAASGDPYLI